MKDIKFRACKKIDKRMYHDVTWDCIDVEPRELYYPGKDELEANLHDNFIIMQYTGLKDCKGFEVYEGDIVVVEFYKDCRCSKLKEKAIIEFYANSWCTDIGYFYPKSCDGWIRSIASDDSLEVIGNIHQNPGQLTKGI